MTEWPAVPLGSVLADIQPGFASGRHNSEGEGIPHFRPMNVTTEGRIERSVMRFIDPSIGRPDVRLISGDIVFNNTNSPELVGKTALFEDDDSPAFSNHMTRLRVDGERLDARYAALRLHQAWREGWFAEHCNNHVSQASIGRDVLSSFVIELPPLDVQRSIASLTESIEGRRSSASVHLRSAGKALEHFRQAALRAACSGRLTTDWRDQHSSVELARDQLESLQAERRDRLGRRYKPTAAPLGEGELPDSWAWTTVGALVDVSTGATPLRRRADYFNGSIPWVTSGAVNAGIITEASEFITDLAIRETNAKVFPAGTLLIAMYGEGQTRGRVAQLGIDAATNQAVAALTFDGSNEHLRPYLRTFFLENYERIRLLSFGGVQPNLSLGVIRDTPVPLPPRDEQAEIIRRVDELMTLAASLRTRIGTASHLVDRSAQSVLAKALRGDLLAGAA